MELLTQTEMYRSMSSVVDIYKKQKRELLEEVKRTILKYIDLYGCAYPDQIDNTWINSPSLNIVGAAFLSLKYDDKIEKTGNYRNSLSRNSRGRIIFEYRRKI